MDFITAAYHPMTDVAGDFYEYISVDPNRSGFLVADVTGHGIPAALIAAMTKVAMQSVIPHANDPSQLLAKIHRWQPVTAAQHDDITLIVVDVV